MGLGGRALREVRHRGGVDAARQEHRDRHVAREVQADVLLQHPSELLLLHLLPRRGPGDGPERLRPEDAAAAVELEGLTRPEQLDALYGGARADDEPAPRDGRRRAEVEPGRPEEPGGEQRPDLRRERDRPGATGVRVAGQVERLHPEGIPGEEEPPRRGVPEGDGEHAPGPPERVGAVPAEGPQQDGRVPGGREGLAGRGEPLPELDVVVDLAVERDDVPGRRVHHRLRAGGGEVEDREAPVREHRGPAPLVRGRLPRPRAVGPAVDHRGAHRRERRAVARGPLPDDPRDPAHGRSPPSRG